MVGRTKNFTKDEEENRVKKAIQEAQNENSFERVNKLVTEFSVVAYNVRCMFMFVHLNLTVSSG